MAKSRPISCLICSAGEKGSSSFGILPLDNFEPAVAQGLSHSAILNIFRFLFLRLFYAEPFAPFGKQFGGMLHFAAQLLNASDSLVSPYCGIFRVWKIAQQL